MQEQQGSLIKGVLLVSGTSIGAGMLALPVLTSLGGFFPSLLIYFFCWLLMMSTGLLMLEVYLWMNQEGNLVSMAEKSLGKTAKIVAWFLYVFLFYSLTLAYVIGCGNLLVSVFGGHIPSWLGQLLFVFAFVPFVYAGTRIANNLNLLLMCGLAISYLTFVIIGSHYIQTEFLFERNWILSLKGLPVTFTAFAFQATVPTLADYLNRDLYRTKMAIFIGTLIPLAAYIIWAWLILGIVPVYGPGGLAEAIDHGYSAVEPLKKVIQNPFIYIVGEFFAFFALVTSLIGVVLGMIDFLADGFSIKKTEKGKAIICSFIFIPVLIISMTHPTIFLEALNFAGGYGCALLLGLFPILMVWVIRYKMGHLSHVSLPGGKVYLLILLLFVLFEVFLETKHLFN